MLLALLLRELESALRASARWPVATSALHCGHSLAGRPRHRRDPRPHADVVDGSVAQHVAAEVEDETVGLARMQPESATDHLIEQARRHRRRRSRHAVDVRGIEAGGEDVDVREVASSPVRNRFRIAARSDDGVSPQTKPHSTPCRACMTSTTWRPWRTPLVKIRMERRSPASAMISAHAAWTTASSSMRSSTSPGMNSPARMKLVVVGRLRSALRAERAEPALHDGLLHADLVADVVEHVLRAQISPDFKRYGVAVRPITRR
ncbi:MAG: hypothetical protein U0575_04195 [Phycisphaerales bacterium]